MCFAERTCAMGVLRAEYRWSGRYVALIFFAASHDYTELFLFLWKNCSRNEIKIDLIVREISLGWIEFEIWIFNWTNDEIDSKFMSQIPFKF